MSTKYSDLVASTQEKIDSDVDFQNSLVDLSDEDKTQAISTKQQELLDSELAALEEKTTKAERAYESQKIRAEKAEAAAKRPPETSAPKNEVLAKKEQILEARALNSLHEEDIEEVVAIAEAKKISLSEAIKSPYVKAFIQTRDEERKTAAAANTGPSRKSSTSKSDGETLLKKVDGYQLSPDEMKDGAKAMIAAVFGK